MLASVVLVLVSCGPTAGDKLLLEQNYHAGNYVASEAKDAHVKQAGRDLALNSKTLMENLGAPSVPVGEYSAEASEKYREQSKEEHAAESGFLGMLKGVAESSGVPWAGAIVGLLTAGVAIVRKQVQTKKLHAVYNGVGNIIKTVKENDGLDVASMPDLIVDTMRTAAVAHKSYIEIKKDLKDLRAKGVVN